MIEELTKLYESKREDLIRAYKSRAGANDVEDLVQEAFYRALACKDLYKPEFVGGLEPWLVGILNNCLKDLLNEKLGRASMHQEFDEEAIEPAVLDKEPVLREDILRLLKTKSGDVKQICYLYFVMQYKLSEIQKVIGCSYSNVNNVVDRFKVKLREELRS